MRTPLFLTLFVLATLTATTQAQESTNGVERISQQEVVEASLYGKIDVVKEALKQGYEINQLDPDKRTALMFASFNGHTAIVGLLIKEGADINAQDNIGTSALMFAASGPSTNTVQLLLDHGAEINMVDNNEHFSALMWAAAEGQPENVKLLLKNNADTTLQDIDGDTAASFAEKAGHAEVVALFKETVAQENRK